MRKIAILGGGSWGTALAIVLSRSRRAHDLSLWVHDSALATSLRRDRENGIYLPGHLLPASIEVMPQVQDAVAGAEIIVGAVPAAYARGVYSAAMSHVRPEVIVVSGTKGLEPSSHKRMSEVISEVFVRRSASRVAVSSDRRPCSAAANPSAIVFCRASMARSMCGQIHFTVTAMNAVKVMACAMSVRFRFIP